MVDFLLDLADPWGYALIFLLALAEGAALLGLFLPGETAMILGGVLASQGRATLGGMLVAGCLGSAVGDSIGYWVGHRFGNALRASRLGRKIGQERWDRALRFLRNRGPSAVFFGRFLGFLRTLVPPLAGSSDLPYRRFVLFNAPAAVLWAAIFIVLGFAAGAGWRVVKEWAGRASLILLILLLVAIALFLTARWVRRRVDNLVVRSERVLRHPLMRPVIAHVRSRFDPAERFGLFLTVGLGVALASAVALGGILDSVSEGGDVIRVDAALLQFFQEHRDPRLDTIMRVVAGAGNVTLVTSFTAALIAGVAVFSRRWSWVGFGAALLIGALFLDDGVRLALDLIGISFTTPAAAADGSFPSPQLTAAGAAVGGTTYVLARTRSWSRAVVLSAAMLFVFFGVTVSLMYLGRQTPSAMATGFLLGLLWAAISGTSSNQIWHFRQRRAIVQ